MIMVTFSPPPVLFWADFFPPLTANDLRASAKAHFTLIMLTPTNRNRDVGGKVIFSETSDIVDDVDCVYTLDLVCSINGRRTVIF